MTPVLAEFVWGRRRPYPKLPLGLEQLLSRQVPGNDACTFYGPGRPAHRLREKEDFTPGLTAVKEVLA